MTLTEFLLARIAEDEDRARDLRPPLMRHVVWIRTQTIEDRVLADCEAKRRIVAEHAPRQDGLACSTCGGYTETSDGVRGIVHHGYAIPWPCPTLRALALPFADHPDYRDEWKP